MAIFNHEKDEEFEFSPEIRAAFEAYPRLRGSREFDARYWAQFDDRRSRYQGILGLCRRLYEVEIEGVAVWRLAASTLSGIGVCAVFFICTLPQSKASLTEVPSPVPSNEIPTMLTALALYTRRWEDETTFSKPLPKSAPPRPKMKGGISWTGSNALLA